MNLTVLTVATPKTATTAATFNITLAKDADLMTTLTALTACGYSKTDAIKAMARAAEGGAVTRAEIIPQLSSERTIACPP